jgi:hypothetical protein
MYVLLITYVATWVAMLAACVAVGPEEARQVGCQYLAVKTAANTEGVST